MTNMVEYYDIMSTLPENKIDRLPEALWAPGGVDQRSRELTPLYIEHFHGPMASRLMTAHPFWEVIIICDGEGEMKTRYPFPLRPGVICLMPPRMAHNEVSTGVMEILWIGLRGSRLDHLPRTHPLVAQSSACLRSALACWNVARNMYGEIGSEIDGLTMVLFAHLRQALASSGNITAHHLEQAVGYLQAHYHEEIDVPALATLCGYSEGYFYRAFKQLTGKTPIQYLTAIRIQEALRWLEHSDFPINRIAAAVGFADQHYFARIIKQHTGRTPLAVRSNARLSS